MEFEIYGEAQKEKKVILKLEKSGECIKVVAVNSDGSRIMRGHLLTFTKDGTVAMSSRVSDDLGFDLNTDGSITTTRW